MKIWTYVVGVVVSATVLAACTPSTPTTPQPYWTAATATLTSDTSDGGPMLSEQLTALSTAGVVDGATPPSASAIDERYYPRFQGAGAAKGTFQRSRLNTTANADPLRIDFWISNCWFDAYGIVAEGDCRGPQSWIPAQKSRGAFMIDFRGGEMKAYAHESCTGKTELGTPLTCRAPKPPRHAPFNNVANGAWWDDDAGAFYDKSFNNYAVSIHKSGSDVDFVLKIQYTNAWAIPLLDCSIDASLHFHWTNGVWVQVLDTNKNDPFPSHTAYQFTPAGSTPVVAIYVDWNNNVYDLCDHEH